MREQESNANQSRALAMGAAAALLVVLPTASGLLRGDIRPGLDPFALPDLVADLFVLAAAAVLLAVVPGGEVRGRAGRTPAARARLVVVNLALAVVFLAMAAALPKILSHRSDVPQVLGRYAYDYLAFIVACVALTLGAGAALGLVLWRTLAGDDRWLERLRPLRRNPFVIGLLVTGLAVLRFALPFINRQFVAGRYLEAESTLVIVALGVTALVLYESHTGEGEHQGNRFKWFERAVVALLCIFALLRWVNTLSLSEDSTIYLTTAINFVRTGRLFYYLNWPSGSLAPGVEFLTEWPPGFPIYLAPFVWLFHNPVNAALIAYSVVIILFYATAYLLTRALRFPVDLTVLFFLLLTLLAPYDLILRYLWSEIPFTVVSLGVMFCSVQLIREQRRQYWILGLALAFLGTWIRHIGIFNFAFLLVPAWLAGKRARYGWAAAALLASVSPMGIWLARNRVLFGNPDQVHAIGAMIYTQNLGTPFTFLYHLFTPISLIVLLAAMLAPFLPRWRRQAAAWTQLSFLAGTGVHFIGLYTISLIAIIGPLTDRMMVPVLTFGLLAAFDGLNVLTGGVREGNRRLNVALIALFGTVVLSPPFAEVAAFQGIDYPDAMYLWGELHEMDVIQSATHFYTRGGDNTIHQVFAGMPQRELYRRNLDRLTSDSDYLADLLAIGKRPFFLAEQGDDLMLILEMHVERGELDKIEFTELGYALYYSPNEFSEVAR
jgi:hypothetical protein